MNATLRPGTNDQEPVRCPIRQSKRYELSSKGPGSEKPSIDPTFA
jgi:hypothetical protein